ncbi:SDR family NAD(P)-dependent oxidoreductase [Devosia sp. A369]
MNDLRNRAVILTGASGGIGQALALGFAERGASVHLFDRAETVIAQAEALKAQGFKAAPYVLDVTDENAVTVAVDAAVAQDGKLDILINNAGINLRRDGRKVTVEETTIGEWSAVLNVNLTSTFILCRTCVPHMRRNGYGRIINMASQAARMRSDMTSAVYAASKAGMVAFARQLAGEVAGSGITVNSIAPGATHTAMRSYASAKTDEPYLARTPVGRVGQPSDILNAALFLASAASAYVHGTIIDVNGGYYMP